MSFNVCPNCKCNWGIDGGMVKCIGCDMRAWSDTNKTCCWKNIGKYVVEWYLKTNFQREYSEIFERSSTVSIKHIKTLKTLLPFDLTEEKLTKLLMML
jgi:hypothetical protein